MKCPHCNQEHPDGFQFCPITGEKLDVLKACTLNPKCPDHGRHILPMDSLFCPTCGCKLENASCPTVKETDRNKDANGESEVKLSDILQSLIDNMVQVKGDSFIMGNEYGTDTSPAHFVELRTFRISKYPVTQEQWEAIMGWNPSLNKGPQLPVDHVSWLDCCEFINKLNELTGLSFRLPTEAEWEFSARGGKKSQNYIYSGSHNPNTVAWTYDNSEHQTHDVGMLLPNELGLYDMSGNISEWCEDVYDECFYARSSKFNPLNNAGKEKEQHVLRGGSIEDGADFCKVYTRNYDDCYEEGYYGLRLAHNKTMKFDSEQVKNNEYKNKGVNKPSSQGIINNIKNDMVYVEGGSFMMGATIEQGTEFWDNEKPVHRVTLSSFHICKHVVTIKEWEAVMGKNKYVTGDPKFPVSDITWNECQSFCKKLNSITGMNYRLPTEAEWEYAARGGNKSQGFKYSGSDNIEDVANCGHTLDSWTNPLCKVMQKHSNELGIFDMSGNVWEWCEDWFGEYQNVHLENPTGPYNGEYRVVRGGDATSRAGRCRVSSRDLRREGATGVGFRLVY